MSIRTRGLALGVIAIAPLAACSPTIRKPMLLHPGPANVQRFNAAQFDPYPPTDLGPEIVGGRPIDYMTPVPEVERARQFKNREQPINLAVPGQIVVAAPAAPVFVPTAPPAAMLGQGGVPVYATTPIATQPPVTTQPPAQVRY